MSDFANRLKKNAGHRFKWAQRSGLTAFRLYDLDMPEWPVAVDWYAGFVHVMDFPRGRRAKESAATRRAELLTTLTDVLEVPTERIFLKCHEPQVWGERQYERVARAGHLVQVTEGGLSFECNLSDYLDTGLFLDHRVTRSRVRALAAGKRFLNLFAYTGSFSVYAAAGSAARTTTVDLSGTYCDWAKRNLHRNAFTDESQHAIVCADVMGWIASCRDRFDLIVLDPPSFSTSKKMKGRFEVQKHHRRLIEDVLGLLSPGGSLFFSTNFLRFELDQALSPALELTPKSIPEDFRRTVHRCWRFDAAP
jgi:23S rRNA (cytosine1962-C5)-methyltransferase